MVAFCLYWFALPMRIRGAYIHFFKYLYNVGFDTPTNTQICLMVCCLPSYNWIANLALSGFNFLGRPPIRPLTRAACNPAWVRSRIRFRSNSAKAPKMWKVSFPALDDVSIDSWRFFNPIPLSWSFDTSSIKSFNERDSLSNRQTTITSPLRVRTCKQFQLCLN